MRELFESGSALGEDPAFEATHVEQQVGIVFAVHGHERILPLNGGHWAGETVLDVPEYGASAANKFNENNQECTQERTVIFAEQQFTSGQGKMQPLTAPQMALRFIDTSQPEVVTDPKSTPEGFYVFFGSGVAFYFRQ